MGGGRPGRGGPNGGAGVGGPASLLSAEASSNPPPSRSLEGEGPEVAGLASTPGAPGFPGAGRMTPAAAPFFAAVFRVTAGGGDGSLHAEKDGAGQAI